MEKNDLEVMLNSAQIAEPLKREVITISDFEQVSLTDVHNMFGSWKETDHCDKDIQS